MKSIDLKKTRLVSIKNKLTLEEMQNVMGSGEGFGWGHTYSLGCIDGQELFVRDYNVFWIGIDTEVVALVSC